MSAYKVWQNRSAKDARDCGGGVRSVTFDAWLREIAGGWQADC